MHTLFTAFSLMLVLEGLAPLLAPRAWRSAMQRVTAMADGQIRFFGLGSLALGLALLALASLLAG